MSIQAVSWVLENSVTTGSARLVLISIANHASKDNDWVAWAASRTTSREAAVKSHATVLAALAKIEATGEIKVLDRGGPRMSMRVRVMFMDERSESDHSPEQVCGHELTAAVSPDEPQRSTQTDQNRKEPSGTKNLRAEASPPADEPRTFNPFEEDFNRTWKHYPHKEARKAALKAYQSRRRGGVDPVELHRATQVYAFVLKATGRTPMNGATFYGPNERWKDWLDRDVALARERGRGGSGRPGGQDPPVGRPNPTEAERCSKCGSLIVGGLCGCP